MTEPRTFILELPPGTPIISGNNRLNRYVKNRMTQDLKQVIGEVAWHARLPQKGIGRADIAVLYFSPPRLRAKRHPFASDAISDSDNIAPTAKALADGLVKAGVWPVDSRRCVRQVTCKLADETHPRGLLRVTITEVAGNE